MADIEGIKIGVLLALEVESQGLFQQKNIALHFSGIGKINATFTVTEMILKHGFTHIINLGTAGSHRFKTHDMVECSGYAQRDMDLSPLGFMRGETPFDHIPERIGNDKFYTDLPRGICGTGDSFEINTPKVSCDLVDMEAYAIAKVCQKLKVEFISLKYVSDGSDHNAHNDWVENLSLAAKALSEMCDQVINSILEHNVEHGKNIATQPCH